MHTTVLIYSVVGGKYKDNPGIHVYIPIYAEAIDKGMKRMQTSIGKPPSHSPPIQLLCQEMAWSYMVLLYPWENKEGKKLFSEIRDNSNLTVPEELWHF